MSTEIVIISSINIQQDLLLKMPIFQSLGQGSENHGPQAKSGPLSVSVNKVLLDHSHIGSFTYYLWLLLCYRGRGKWFLRPHDSQSLNYVLSDPPQKKSVNPHPRGLS